MATTAYSGTPLIKKLGIAPTTKIQLIHPPGNYYELLGQDIADHLVQKNEVPDLVHLFVTNVKEFESAMRALKKTAVQQNPNIVIWISWYKKSSGIKTDITEDVIRNFALKNELVDVKVCAVSDTWSGLKLVVPVAKRGQFSKKL